MSFYLILCEGCPTIRTMKIIYLILYFFNLYKNKKAIWIDPPVLSETMWDYKISENTVDCKELMLNALKAPLSKSNESLLLEALKMSPEIAFEWDPSNIPNLVEFCPNVALEALFIYAENKKESYFHRIT